ncbi:MAG: hypothetical protein AABY03_01755 [Nanoarchaeota archaeon]
MKGVLIFLLLIVSLGSLLSADNASSSSYSIESYHQGSSGSNGTSSSYSATTTTTYQQGVGNISSTTFTGKSFWFPLIPTVEETPSTTSTPSASAGSSGSGGGGSISSIVNQISSLKITPTSFGLPGTIGINSSARISLENIGTEILNIEISLVNLNEIVFFENTNLILVPGESTSFNFQIIPPNEPGIVTGKIVFNHQGLKNEIPFALNVNEEFSLFDVSIELAERTITQGQKLNGQITLLQAGLQEEVDIVIEYEIRDFEGNTYGSSSETLAVLREKTFEHEFDSSELQVGDYIVAIEVIYSGGIATASHQFKVVEKGASVLFSSIFLIILAIAIFILVILVVIAKNYKENKNI